MIANYINGELVAPKNNEYLDVFNPAIGKAYAKVPNSTSEDVNLAIAGAKEAFPAWAKLSSGERSAYLSLE